MPGINVYDEVINSGEIDPSRNMPWTLVEYDASNRKFFVTKIRAPCSESNSAAKEAYELSVSLRSVGMLGL